MTIFSHATIDVMDWLPSVMVSRSVVSVQWVTHQNTHKGGVRRGLRPSSERASKLLHATIVRRRTQY
jgi:hypothetical protein